MENREESKEEKKQVKFDLLKSNSEYSFTKQKTAREACTSIYF